MEKFLKRIKIFVVILLAILLTLVAFFGVFNKEKGVWNNSVKDYTYGMDIGGERELRYTVDESETEKYVYVDEKGNIVGEVWKDGTAITAEDEESSTEEGQDVTESEEATDSEVTYSKETRTIKTNSDDVLTRENFEKVKKVIQKRLNEQGISEYNIRIDDVTGKLVVETGNNNDNVEKVESLLGQVGKFQIVDYQNGLVLMDNSDIKNVDVVYSNSSGYSTYLQIEFNKAGAEKLREISKEYIEIENEAEDKTEEITEEDATTESEEDEEEKNIKYVSIVLDDSTMMTTYFGEEMTQGILQISVGSTTTDYEQFGEYYDSATVLANVLNSGMLPIAYNIETDNFVKSEVTSEMLNRVKIAVVILVIVVSVLLVIKSKLIGLFAAILSIGYVAALSLVIRYTNVTITMNSFIAAVLVAIMNCIFIKMFFKFDEEEKSNAFSQAMKRFYLNTIPVDVIAIVFTFATELQISSIGMVLFWGMILIAVYNILFTRTVFMNMKKRK